MHSRINVEISNVISRYVKNENYLYSLSTHYSFTKYAFNSNSRLSFLSFIKLLAFINTCNMKLRILKKHKFQKSKV